VLAITLLGATISGREILIVAVIIIVVVGLIWFVARRRA
jgi:hypothetical protein